MSSVSIPRFSDDFEFTTLSVAAGVTPVPGFTDDAVTGMQYTVGLRDDWCIGVVPHGGYLATLILNASTKYFTSSPHALPLNQPHPIHCSLTFATRSSIGPAVVSVAPIKLGRQYSFVRVQLLQGGRVCIDATVTHANMDLEKGATLPSRGFKTFSDIPVPDRTTECAPFDLKSDPAGVFRVATKKIEYTFPTESRNGAERAGGGKGCREQWVRLQDGSNAGFGLTDLGFVGDMFMPIPENYAQTRRLHWYPTLSLSLEIKKLPPPGGWKWLFVRIEAGVIKNGRFDINVTICNEDKEIVAISRHVAVILDATRNNTKVAVAKL